MKLTNLFEEIQKEVTPSKEISVDHLINLLRNNMITNKAAKPHMNKWIKRGVPGGMVTLTPREYQLWKDIKLGGPKSSMYGPKNEEALNETKGLFKEAKVSDPCECCNYFDFDGLEDKYPGLKHPIYFMVEKGESHQLKHISPKQYIYKIADGFGGLSWEDVVDTGAVSQDNVKKYAEAMKRGDKFPIGFYREGESGQEGRHRALALMELGCEEMPIVVIKKVNTTQQREFVEYFKDYSREQLDAAIKDMGYNGVSDLDWKDFRRYIDYRL